MAAPGPVALADLVEFTDKPFIKGQYADGRLQFETVPPIKLPAPGNTVQDFFAGLVTLEEAYTRYLAYRSKIETSEAQVGGIGFPRKTKFHELGYHVDLVEGVRIYFQNEFIGHKKPPQTWTNWPTTPPILEDS